MKDKNIFFIYADGGAINNPGPAGIGVVIYGSSGQILEKISKFIGNATNNQAEYQAVIEGLKKIKDISKNNLTEVHYFLDSKLVVEQLNQRYKIKDKILKELFWQIRDLVFLLGGRILFEYIPREKNRLADKLVNLAIRRIGKSSGLEIKKRNV